jgi:hypothetical protein
MLLAETLPAGPGGADLLLLLGYMVAAGMVYVMYHFTRAVSGGISIAGVHIPGLSSILPSPVNAVFHWMEREMASALAGLDAQVATYWHQLSVEVRAMAATIEQDAHALYVVAKWAYTHAAGPSLAEQIRNAREKAAHAQATSAAAAQAATHANAIARANHPPAYVYKMGAIAAELPGVIGRDIPNLRDTVAAAERAISDLWKRVRGNAIAYGSLAFTGAAVWALTRVGAGWLRCSNWRRIGRAGCNMNPALLDSLLAGSLALSGGFSIVALAEECQRFAPTVTAGVDWVVTELD